LGAFETVVVFDAEVGNSTGTDEFAKAFPERFFEVYIAEQQMIAAAVGMSVRGYRPFAATFAAFLSRAYDFIRMAAISGADLLLCGSHAGVEIGQDGPSQMGLEDLAAMRAVHGSTVLYPSDATSAVALTRAMLDRKGVVYLRTTRGAYPVLYSSEESFSIGGAKILQGSKDDSVALIGAGVTVHECLAAAKQLEKAGIHARVIDLYSIKPLDLELLRETSRIVSGRLVVAEDHYPEGGVASAVVDALASDDHPPRVVRCAVRGLPTSGTPEQLLDAAGISARYIADAARSLVGQPSGKGAGRSSPRVNGPAPA
jgi:transketolase